MSQSDNNAYVLVKDTDGERFLCPINTTRKFAYSVEDLEDCIEEDVIGRYAGNITIKQ
jgi:hypothetical protein